MLKGITRNKPCHFKSVYEIEHKELHDFLASNDKSVCFEYGNAKEAEAARAALKKYIDNERMPLVLCRRCEMLFAGRKGK